MRFGNGLDLEFQREKFFLCGRFVLAQFYSRWIFFTGDFHGTLVTIGNLTHGLFMGSDIPLSRFERYRMHKGRRSKYRNQEKLLFLNGPMGKCARSPTPSPTA